MNKYLLAAGLGAILLSDSDCVHSQGFTVGDRVTCDGSIGQIVRTEPRAGWNEPFSIVRLEGAGAGQEYRCLQARMRAAPGNPEVSSTTSVGSRPGTSELCRPGAKLEAQWGIEWYEVTVREAPNSRGQCPVSFDGYGRDWDNVISLDQLRPRTGENVRRPENPVVDSPGDPARGSSAPDGNYRCHKISPGGQLLDIGDLTVAGGRATMQGMPESWVVRSVSVIGKDDRGQPLVAVDYTSAAGWNDRLDCVAP